MALDGHIKNLMNSCLMDTIIIKKRLRTLDEMMKNGNQETILCPYFCHKIINISIHKVIFFTKLFKCSWIPHKTLMNLSQKQPLSVTTCEISYVRFWQFQRSNGWSLCVFKICYSSHFSSQHVGDSLAQLIYLWITLNL